MFPVIPEIGYRAPHLPLTEAEIIRRRAASRARWERRRRRLRLRAALFGRRRDRAAPAARTPVPSFRPACT